MQFYPEKDITLIISIDKSDILEVEEIARNYKWEYGSKKNNYSKRTSWIKRTHS